LLSLLIDVKSGSNIFLRNIRISLDYTALYHDIYRCGYLKSNKVYIHLILFAESVSWMKLEVFDTILKKHGNATLILLRKE
jgi:hypothetical protein